MGTLGALIAANPPAGGGEPLGRPAAPDPIQQEAGKIEQLLASPEVQTGLLQFGVKMLQPPGFGDTFGGRLGRSLGAAGEAVGRVQQTQRDINQQAVENQLEGRRVAAQESRAGSEQRRVGTLEERNRILRDELRERADENIRAMERFSRELGTRRRGQNIDLFSTVVNANSRRAQALIEQALLADSTQAQAMLDEASRLMEFPPFEILRAEIESGGLSQRTVDGMLAATANAGQPLESMIDVLEGYGATKDQLLRGRTKVEQATQRQSYAPIPQPVTPQGGLPNAASPPSPAQPAPQPGPGARGPTTSAQADAALAKVRSIDPETMTEQQFLEIQNDPAQRAAAKRVWGIQDYNEASRRFSMTAGPRGGGRGMLGVGGQ